MKLYVYGDNGNLEVRTIPWGMRDSGKESEEHPGLWSYKRNEWLQVVGWETPQLAKAFFIAYKKREIERLTELVKRLESEE